MMYIVGVIHTIYWLPVTENVFKSLLLFEMPVVFFITGASYTLSNPKSYYNYLISRFSRILIPYLGFVSFIIFIEYVSKILGTSIKTVSLVEFIVKTINPFRSPPVNLRFVSWHLWFIPTYILLILLIPLLYKIFCKFKDNYKYMPLAILALAIFMLENLDVYERVKNIVFYSFWIYIGFFYNKLKSIDINLKIKVLTIIVLTLILFLLGITDRYTLDMQFNKFPPNFIFLIYSMTMLSIIYILKPYLLKLDNITLINNFIGLYSKYGFTLYLYQPFTYLLIYPIYLNMISLSNNTIYTSILTIITIVTAIVLNTIFIKPFGKLEMFKISRIVGLKLK